MPYFCRSGHQVVTVEQFLDFVDGCLPQEPVIDLPRITGQDFFDVAEAKKVYCWWYGLDGWGLERDQGFAARLVVGTTCVAEHGGVY